MKRRGMLVVEDDSAMLHLIGDELRDRGFNPTLASTVPQAYQLIDELVNLEVVITDLNLKQGSGLDIVRAVHAVDPDLPVILITAFGTMQTAIEAMRRGVYDFITKPFDFDYLAMVCERALEFRRLRREVLSLRLAMPHQEALDGESLLFRRLLERLVQVAPTRATILLQGESGTGKTRLASLIHKMSRRAAGPLVIENVAAIPENLIESELFGHVKGAFTGAEQARRGLFERAAGGTLVLDEIGELPLSLQPKLLRVLEEKRMRPVGSDREVEIDVRLIAATNRDLQSGVSKGWFREDLYFRLAVMELEIPPLRERGNDVLVLAQRFVDAASEEFGKPVVGLSPAAARTLLSYAWPGNIRELKNAIEKAVLLTRYQEIHPADLPERVQQPAHEHTRALPAQQVEEAVEGLLTLEEVERRHILRVLDAVDGNKAQAARILNVGRKTLYRKLEAWGLDVSE